MFGFGPPRSLFIFTMAAKVTPKAVGEIFARQYYNTLHERPEDLFRFYKEESEFAYNSSESVLGAQVLSRFALMGFSHRVSGYQGQDCRAGLP